MYRVAVMMSKYIMDGFHDHRSISVQKRVMTEPMDAQRLSQATVSLVV